jgi:hypothetical protein
VKVFPQQGSPGEDIKDGRGKLSGIGTLPCMPVRDFTKAVANCARLDMQQQEIARLLACLLACFL